MLIISTLVNRQYALSSNFLRQSAAACLSARLVLARGMYSIYDLPGHMIRRLQQIAVSAFTSELEKAGFELTPVQFGAMCVLDENPGIDQATLAGLIAYDRVTIGGVISRLENRGLIERSVSREDRRARVLHLSERGSALLRTVWPAVRRAQDMMTEGLEPEERQEFMRLMRKIAEASNELSRAPLRTGE